jgi:hypothetical protein
VHRHRSGIGAQTNSVALSVYKAVPIYKLLEQQGSFGPEEMAALGNVFDHVLGALGLINRQDPLTSAVAKTLFDLASAGVRDPDRLKHLTVQAFTER